MNYEEVNDGYMAQVDRFDQASKAKRNAKKKKTPSRLAQCRALGCQGLQLPSDFPIWPYKVHCNIKMHADFPYSVLDAINPVVGDEEFDKLLHGQPCGWLEVWCLTQALTHYCSKEMGDNLIWIALWIKDPILFSFFLFVAVPYVQEKTSFSWGSAALAEKSMEILGLMMKCVPEVAALADLGQSAFLTGGSFYHVMGFVPLNTKWMWWGDSMAWSSLKMLMKALREFRCYVRECRAFPDNAIAEESVHRTLKGMVKGSDYPYCQIVRVYLLGWSVLDDVMVYLSSASAGLWHSCPLTMGSGLRDMHLFTSLSESPHAFVKEVARLLVKQHASGCKTGPIMHCVSATDILVLMCEAHAIVKHFIKNGYGSVKDLLRAIHSFEEGHVDSSRADLLAQHCVGVRSVTVSRLRLLGGSFSPKNVLLKCINEKKSAYRHVSRRVLLSNRNRTHFMKGKDFVVVCAALVCNKLGASFVDKLNHARDLPSEHAGAGEHGGESAMAEESDDDSVASDSSSSNDSVPESECAASENPVVERSVLYSRVKLWLLMEDDCFARNKVRMSSFKLKMKEDLDRSRWPAVPAGDKSMASLVVRKNWVLLYRLLLGWADSPVDCTLGGYEMNKALKVEVGSALERVESNEKDMVVSETPAVVPALGMSHPFARHLPRGAIASGASLRRQTGGCQRASHLTLAVEAFDPDEGGVTCYRGPDGK
jgi:hypothetical protein